MKWKILGVLGAIIIGSVHFGVQPAMAAECDKSLLGFKPWYSGVCEGEGANTKIKKFCAKDETGTSCDDGMAINTFVWIVVLNIMFDVSLAAGYIATAMMIYSGYLYLMAQSDSTKMANAKKTLSSAIIGMVITLGATVIVNTLKTVLGITGDAWKQDLKSTVIQDAFNWAYMIAGAIAVAFMVKNGIEFMLSTGDAGKVRKAQTGLIVSVVGLLLIVLASVITGFILSTLTKASA